MKKLLILVLSLLMVFACFSVSFARESCRLISKYKFTNTADHAIKTNSLTIKIGQRDLVGYQFDDDITITPTPDSKEYDEYGNLYVTYSMGTYNAGRSMEIILTRDFTTGTYREEIPNRTSSTVNSENRLYTFPATNIECDDSEIIAKAKEITYNVSSDYKKAMALYEYVNTNLTYDKTGETKGAYNTLKNKRGVCEDYACLYAALCRACGIPCRIIYGYKVQELLESNADRVWDDNIGQYVDIPAAYSYSIGTHAWNEVWFDDFGWVPVDTCVTFMDSKGKKTVSFDYFGKIDATNYIAEGIYNADEPLCTYSSFLKIDKDNPVVTYQRIREEDKIKHSFLDLIGYEWAEDSVNTLYDMGIIKGYTEDEYGPSGNITRIEFISMLSRILRYLNFAPTAKGSIYYYMDYDQNHYSKQDYDFFMKCIEDAYPGFGKYGYAIGMEGITRIFDNSLQPNKPITRGEVVALMDAFIKIMDPEEVSFNDISGYAFESSILKASRAGLIKGYTDGSFKPYNPITRAEIAVILDRYVGVKTTELFD